MFSLLALLSALMIFLSHWNRALGLLHRPNLMTILRQGTGSVKRTRLIHRHLMSMSTTDATAPEHAKQDSVIEVKVLALHGADGNQWQFLDQLQPLCDFSEKRKRMTLKLEAIDAPIPSGDDGYRWWTYEPGERSLNAKVYFGFEDSETLVRQAIQDFQPDIILSHSQGAILMAALLALNNQEGSEKTPNIIMNGVAWPNPYAAELRSIRFDDDDNRQPPNVLFVMGARDRINPMESAHQVRHELERAGCKVEVYQHPGGHSVPTDNMDAIVAIINWIQARVSSE